MTGHIGQRTNRRVALVTTDFRLYHRLARFFERHGIYLLGLPPEEPVPAAVHVLLNGPSSDARSVAVLPDDEATLLAVCMRLDERRAGQPFERLVLGVDPGHVIGLAAVGDGHVIVVAEELTAEAASRRLKRWQPTLHAKRVEVHVGDGAPAVGESFATWVKMALPGIPIHFVPEQSTTPYKVQTKSKHTDAAAEIAMREPRATGP